MATPAKVILVSILSFGRPKNVVNQLGSLPEWLDRFAQESGIHSHIVVRNNDPKTDFGEVAALMAAVEEQYATIRFSLFTDVPNNGFGAGHNGNIASAASDYVLILNDDIGFPHINWMGEAVRLLDSDASTVCVGADENPKHISPLFGNGLMPGAFHLMTLPYAEASVLLFERSAYDKLGGFGADFRWAMCEDSDLSLRVQQNGWRIAHLSMPHQHWRSTSFNSLPGTVKSSILEHNRAALFANWRETLTVGKVGRFEVFDIWSDGIGDVFCALPHILQRLAPLGTERRCNIIINTSHPELFAWLGLDGIRVTSVRELEQLRALLERDGLTALRTMRDVNFSLPFNIHPLLAGALGVDQAGPATMAQFAAMLRRLPLPGGGIRFEAGSYCVVHLEFGRGHEGRDLALGASAELVKLCGATFNRIVLVGRERRLSAKLFGAAKVDILDLQGALSLSQLAAVVANAGRFVGLDSFPSHIAQAACVPAAVYFGAVHPLARVWDEARAWPLTAELDCIGCYHTHLEPSVPFCMRRDVACTTGLQTTSMQAVLASVAAGKPFDWSVLRLRWQALQARLIKLARFHPAPPERLFRAHIVANEDMSNLMYRLTEQFGSLLGGHYHTSTVKALSAQAADLQAELYATRVALDAAQSRQVPQPHEPAGTAYTTQILQLSSLKLAPSRCRLQIAEQWIDAEAFDDDPQISLPLLRGGGGTVQLRLSCVTDADDALQVYWAVNYEEFAAERVHTMPSAGGMQNAHLIFDIAAGDLLQIRIDPCTGAGRSRLRGSLGGMFALVETMAGLADEMMFHGNGIEGAPTPIVIAPVMALPPGLTSVRSGEFGDDGAADVGSAVAQADGAAAPADHGQDGAAQTRSRRRPREKEIA